MANRIEEGISEPVFLTASLNEASPELGPSFTHGKNPTEGIIFKNGEVLWTNSSTDAEPGSIFAAKRGPYKAKFLGIPQEGRPQNIILSIGRINSVLDIHDFLVRSEVPSGAGLRILLSLKKTTSSLCFWQNCLRGQIRFFWCCAKR